MKKIVFLILVLFLFKTNDVLAQSGMTFGEFAKRIQPYFDNALIMDIQNQLPQGSDYRVWGWDVGDYSGDGHNDVGFTIKLAAEKKRLVETYLFVDIDGYLVKVGQFTYPFIETPLEIGVVINNNICMITKKNQQFNWEIQGHSYDNGILLLHDKFTTTKLGNLTYETYDDYLNLRNNVKLLDTKKGEESFFRDYLTIPSYPRGQIIYKGYTSEVFSGYIDYVPKGAYYWNGKEDASMNIRSAYDDSFIYMTVEVTDESVVVANCDTCIADYIQVWFDVSTPFPNGNRLYYISDGNIEFNTYSDSGIFCFSIYPGDYEKKPAYVEITTNSAISDIQKESSKDIKAVSNLTDDGYIIRFRVPYLFLGFEDLPIRRGEVFELGCTIVAVDYDNEFRPEEVTEIATSSFDAKDPSTYGSIILIPQGQWHGKSTNIFKEDIINNLLEYGF